jgi:hypothetical protein
LWVMVTDWFWFQRSHAGAWDQPATIHFNDSGDTFQKAFV